MGAELVPLRQLARASVSRLAEHPQSTRRAIAQSVTDRKRDDQVEQRQRAVIRHAEGRSNSDEDGQDADESVLHRRNHS
jgi:hypothetical protein